MIRSTHRGFTLLELMIVVAILGILVTIAIPKFSSLMAKSNESTTKGNLGALRSALSVYYGNCEGTYPYDNLNSLTVGKQFIEIIPGARFPTTANNTGHGLGGLLSGVATGLISSGATDVADSVSGWYYDNVSGDGQWGRVIPNCTHSDAYGNPWSSF